MSFFKKLFSSKKGTAETQNRQQEIPVSSVYTTDYFDERYTEDPINPGMLDGCLKMIESYFIDNKIARKVSSPVNHPVNLDQVDQEGFGFVLYCKAVQLDDVQATLFLAYAFSEFLITKYGFKLYRDAQPEYPLRGMTLKYNENGMVLSLYPFEYASKVLNGNETFSDMEARLDAQLDTLP